MIAVLLSLLFLVALAVGWSSWLLAVAVTAALLVGLFVAFRVPLWLTFGAIVFFWWFGYRWHKARGNERGANSQRGEGFGATEA